MYPVTFADQLVPCRAPLLRFAQRLANNPTVADDLVQETILRALTHADQFQPGTNLLAWLRAILRNTYFQDRRQERRVEPLDDVMTTSWPSIGGEQESRQWFREVAVRFSRLSLDRREALMLVGANGYSYADAALVAGCPVGTMKSRVARARAEVRETLARRPIPPRRDRQGPELPRLSEAA